MEVKLHSISIGRYTYIEGGGGLKPVRGLINPETENGTVDRLEACIGQSMAYVWFKDGDMIATHLSAALLHYKLNVPEQKEGEDDAPQRSGSDESDDGQGAGMEVGGGESREHADGCGGDTPEPETAEGGPKDDDAKGPRPKRSRRGGRSGQRR